MPLHGHQGVVPQDAALASPTLDGRVVDGAAVRGEVGVIQGEDEGAQLSRHLAVREEVRGTGSCASPYQGVHSPQHLTAAAVAPPTTSPRQCIALPNPLAMLAACRSKKPAEARGLVLPRTLPQSQLPSPHPPCVLPPGPQGVQGHTTRDVC